MPLIAGRIGSLVVCGMRFAAAFALVAACTGCGAGADPSDEEVADWSVVQDSEVRIGGAAEEDSVALLYGVEDAFMRGGELIVANAGAYEVKVFDADDGRVVRAYGGEGEGPGEFRSLVAVAPFNGDSVAALDQDLRRITVFGPEGEPGRTIALDELPVAVYPAGLYPFDDGTLLLTTFTGSRPSDPEGVIRHSSPYLRLSSDGEVLDTIGDVPGETWLRVQLSGGASALTYLPFGLATRVAVGGDRAFIGDGESYDVAVIDTLGRTVSTIRGPVSPLPVTDEIRRRFEEERLESASPERRQRMTELYESISYPERMPAYDRLRVDAVTGELWVRRYPEPGAEAAEWDVFDATDGSRIASISLDAGLEVLDVVDARFLGLHRDELDREIIGVYGVSRTDG